jgi:hypothetical protein
MKNLINNFNYSLDLVGEFFSRMQFNKMSYRFCKLYQNLLVILSNLINIYRRQKLQTILFDIEGLSNIKNYNCFCNDLVICIKKRL